MIGLRWYCLISMTHPTYQRLRFVALSHCKDTDTAQSSLILKLTSKCSSRELHIYGDVFKWLLAKQVNTVKSRFRIKFMKKEAETLPFVFDFT